MIYFDNAATTKCSARVIKKMQEVMEHTWGNPSSVHQLGLASKDCIDEARVRIADTIGAEAESIVFTSGGTESNNLAILGGAAMNPARKRIITTSIEHPCVIAPANRLKNRAGYDSIFLGTDHLGLVNLEELRACLNADTRIVSVMYVNNEIGTIQDIPEIGRMVKEYDPDILFHVDATQAYGKFPFTADELHADLITTSGHKINGPKGVGCLYIRNPREVDPVLIGGGQQWGKRSGTENLYSIAGFGEAALENAQTMQTRQKQLEILHQRFIEGVRELPGTRIHGPGEGVHAANHIVSVACDGVTNFDFMDALSARGIMVSAGSACSCLKKRSDGSMTLKAIGVTGELLHETLRFSFDANNTVEEVEEVLGHMRELLPVLRREEQRG